MKSKKVTMLAAALVVAVVAFAAVGYAIDYTAKTTNTNNSMESTYITMVQGSAAAYDEDFFDKIYFDTITEKKVWGSDTEKSVKTAYIPKYNAAVDVTAKTMVLNPESGANAAYVSRALTLEIARENSTADDVTLDVTVSNFTPITGLTYTMALVSGGTVEGMVNYDGSKWSFTDVNIAPTSPAKSVTYNVYLFVSMTDTTEGASIIPGADQKISTAGFNMAAGSTTEADSVFTFVATATAA